MCIMESNNEIFRPGETMMNSLLFNAALFLVSSITVNQFVTDAFSGYASSTAISGEYFI